MSTNIAPATVQEAVNNILYNAPQVKSAPLHRHVLNCLVSNEPGVLSRVSGILAGRGFNIDSLVVAKTEVKDLSRMTVVLAGSDAVVEQAIKQLEDIVPMWAVLNYSGPHSVQREVLLAKISTAPYEMDDMNSDDHVQGPDYAHRQAIAELCRMFGAKVVDVGTDSMIVELCAKSTRVDAFVELLRPFGILEAARSGTMAMPRCHLARPDHDPEVEEQAEMDATLLPPG